MRNAFAPPEQSFRSLAGMYYSASREAAARLRLLPYAASSRLAASLFPLHERQPVILVERGFPDAERRTAKVTGASYFGGLTAAVPAVHNAAILRFSAERVGLALR